MWLVIRNLYTGVKAQVLYLGSLSRKFDILQGTGQGRIPAHCQGSLIFCRVLGRGEFLLRLCTKCTLMAY